MFVETNSTMTSAERALAYTNIESEKGHDVASVSLTEGWPTRGKICFTDVSMSYYEGGPKALRDITFQIDPSEKVGIIGRTGAGKSSLLAALMRLNEFAGKIFIDDVNINELNIRQLRRRISVISQKQMLLCGRLRESLYPFDEFTDLEIWEALDHMQMQSVVSRLPDQLYSIIVDSGSNFSVGERQLLHLARVLLQKNKIIIFDEATANVDLKTEGVIHRIIHEEFKDCTVITIAHRLNTILDCDRVMLLDNGKIVEFDDPNVLLQKEDSSFRKMIEISK